MIYLNLKFWEFIVSVFVAIATFLAVIVALFGKQLRNLIYYPKLEFDFSDKNCIHSISCYKKTDWTITYLRLKIKNIGNMNASRVKIKCNSIKIDGVEVYPFDPTYFVWSTTHTGNSREGSIYFNLATSEIQYLDLFRFYDNSCMNLINIPVKKVTSNYDPLLKSIPAEYPDLIIDTNKKHKFLIEIFAFGNGLKTIKGEIKFVVVSDKNGKINIKNEEFNILN